VRTITALAETNSSAINYYFQSRENLLAEVGRRRMEVHNERISERLAEIEIGAGAATVEDVFRPLVETAFEIWAKDLVLKSLRKMSIIEPLVIASFSAYEVNQIYNRMLSYLIKACPHFTPLDIEWRFRISFGAVMYQLMVRDVLARPILAKEITIERMVRFIADSFADPASSAKLG
jgi:AcrR family transcriptional regulator